MSEGTIPCQAVAVAVAVLGPEAGPCPSKPCLPGAQSEECRTHSLSGHNTSASAGLGKKKQKTESTEMHKCFEMSSSATQMGSTYNEVSKTNTIRFNGLQQESAHLLVLFVSFAFSSVCKFARHLKNLLTDSFFN